MEVLVVGGRKFQRVLLEQFTLWAVSKLFGPKLADNCSFVISLQHFKKKDDVVGSCYGIDERPLPRHFCIELEKKQSPKKLLQTLGHELTHAKQFAKGELKFFVRNHKFSKWNGDLIHEDALNYWECPWEIEAYGREQGLYVMFTEEFGIRDQFKPESTQYTLTPRIKDKSKLLQNKLTAKTARIINQELKNYYRYWNSDT